MRGRRVELDLVEETWVEVHSDLPRRELHARFCRVFGRRDVSLANLKALCTRRGWITGRTGRFEAGHVPANKGRPHPSRGRSAETQFRAGCQSGRARQLYRPIGTERISKDGYLERKVHDGLPMQSRWRAVHLIEWERVNGPLPEGMCLKSVDGDRRNTDPANWRAIPRALLPRLCGRFGRDYDAAPDALKPTIWATAELEHRAREIRSHGTRDNGDTP